MKPAELPPATLEALARSIHADYRRRRAGGGSAGGGSGGGGSGGGGSGGGGSADGGDDALLPWEELPEALRASNRAQALDIGQKLASLGYGVVAGGENGVSPLVLAEAEIEVLARAEHTRFVEERVSAGWSRGPQRDVGARTSPTLVHWRDLSEDERDLDRDAVRLIPALLASADLGVVRRPMK